MHSPEETEQVSRAHQKTTRRTRAEGFLYERIDLNQSISKIQSEMEVAQRYKLLKCNYTVDTFDTIDMVYKN